jgi:hypothetical protein
MYDTHTIDHLFHCSLQSLAAALGMGLQVLLDLDKSIAQGMEEIRFEVVGVIFPD